ncbi:MAG TPA: immunoglobulin domain-containing protein [Verrucomicrobiae bacterium]|nr:immunoglobulin domain-containing protein [Verrucomicrobiae bacterium]
MNYKMDIRATCGRKLATLLFAFAVAALGPFSVALAQPANDQCGGAIELGLDTYLQADLATATTTNDPAPACQPGFNRGVWYRFTAPTNGTYVLSTCGSDIDTALAVYFGNCNFLNPLSGGCNDNDGPACAGAQASLVFNGEGGLTYFILAGAATPGTNGNLSIVITTPGKPIMMQSPQNQSVCANEPVTFDSDAFSYNGATYQWQFNGSNLPGKTAPSLTLPNVQPKDAGNYRVIVTNPQGSVTSSVAKLTVTSQPVIVTPPTSVNATPGSTAEFNVVAGGGGPFTYQWKRNGNNVANGTTPTLLLQNIGTNVSGTYTVSIKNPCGTVQSAPVTLAIVKRALRLGSAAALPGQSVEVPVRLLGSSNENHIVFTVDFNSTFVQLDDIIFNENLHPGATFTWSPSVGRAVVSMQLPAGQVIETGNHELAWLVFSASGNVPGPAAVLLNLGNPTELFNPTGTSMPYASTNGMILITEGVEPPVLSSGTGLFEHDFLVAVPNGGFPADRSLQLKIFDLGEDSRGRLIQVFNATGVSSNVPFVRINGPLPAGVTPVTIQYIVPDRQTTPAPTYQVRQLALAQPAATPGGTPIAIPPNQMSMVNGAVYLKFKTLPDRKYYIQYSSDAVTWNTSTPPLTGNGGWLVWTDNGPPKTPSRPGDQTTRFYRAFLAD